MDLDDSKYILQLARADVLSQPQTPGDWNVHVKRRNEGSAHAEDDHDMREQQAEDAGGSPAGGRLRTEDTDSHDHHSHNHHVPTEGSPRTAKAPRVHLQDTSRALSRPDRLRGQAAGAVRSPSSQREQKYYRMVSAIQPSFGTDPSTMNQGSSASQGQCEGEEYGSDRTTSGRGSQSS